MITFLLRQRALEAVRGTTTKDGGLKFTEHLGTVIEAIERIQEDLADLQQVHAELDGKGRFDREFNLITDEIFRVTQILVVLLNDAGGTQLSIALSRSAAELATWPGKTNGDAANRVYGASRALSNCVVALMNAVFWSPDHTPIAKRSLA